MNITQMENRLAQALDTDADIRVSRRMSRTAWKIQGRGTGYELTVAEKLLSQESFGDVIAELRRALERARGRGYDV